MSNVCGHLGHRTLYSAVSLERINELSSFFTCSYIVRKAKSYFGCIWSNMAVTFWVQSLSNLLHFKNKLMNWANVLHAGSYFIIFGQTTNHVLHLWLLNTELHCSCTCHFRPWHDAQAIARTCAVTNANQEKRGLAKRWKACSKVYLCQLILPMPNAK